MIVSAAPIPRASAPSKLPVIVGGFGPGGAALSLGLVKELGEQGKLDGPLDQHVMAFDTRGEVATRSRNIFLRPEGREVMQELTGTEYGFDTTIMDAENHLRAVAKDTGVPVAYDHEVLDVVDKGSHVDVTVRDTRTNETRTVQGSTFVDASGGRITAANSGPLARAAEGAAHVYVTAQYTKQSPFPGSWGAFDPGTDTALFAFPINKGKDGFVTYYDLPPGVQLARNEEQLAKFRADGKEAILESDALAKYDELAKRLELGAPLTSPQAFNALQHLSKNVTHGNIVKIGDSVGNADPYVAGGFSAALADARDAVKALVAGDDRSMAKAAARIHDGHEGLGWKGRSMVVARDAFLRLMPNVSFDEIKPEDLGTHWALDQVLKAINNDSVRPGNYPGSGVVSDVINGAASAIFGALGKFEHAGHVPHIDLPGFGSRTA